MKKIFLLATYFVLYSFIAQAQISGTVFRDFNGNGVKDNTASFNEIGFGGITVKAYDASGAEVGSVTTASDGTYSFTGLSLPLRIEFTGIVSSDYSSIVGSGNATSVQFYNTASTNADYAINYPDEFSSSTNPKLFSPMYVNGDNQQSGSTSAAGEAVRSFNYDATGLTTVATMGQVGAVWGVAHHKQSGKAFYAAFAKRHVNWGPLGPNGIYVTTDAKNATNTSNTASFVNLNAVNSAFDAGSPVRNMSPGLGDKNNGNYDENMILGTGTTGMGGLDVSDNGMYLYTVNLNDRKAWRIEVGPNGSAPSSASQIVAYTALPNPCTGSTFRPFAIKYYKGEIYVGGVCDGVVDLTNTSSVVDRNNLKATVYKASAFADPTTAVWTQVFEMPLTFNRIANLNLGWGADSGDPYIDPNGTNSSLSISSWHPWSRGNNFAELLSENVNGVMYPQAILSDIEFDVDGSMILGFIDRAGHQGGAQNLGTTGSTTYYGTGTGDLLRVYNDNGTFVLENNGTAGPNTTGGAGNNDGPGGGEYYFHDRFQLGSGTFGTTLDPANHDETSVGGLALWPGSGQVINTVFDPISNWESGGIRWYDNTDGTAKNALLFYASGYPATFGKSSGMGDVELLGEVAPIEIGNRVWNDTDGDGIQDAGEGGIAGVTVELYQGSTLVGTTTTDGNGNYYFNSTNVTGGILPNTSYEIRIDGSQTALGSLILTGANTDGSPNGDERDNDATGSTTAIIALTTGDYGQNNHSYDFGFNTNSCVSTSFTEPNYKLLGWQSSPLSCGTNSTNTSQTFTNWMGSGATATFTYSTNMWDGDAPNVYLDAPAASGGCDPTTTGPDDVHCASNYYGALRWTNNAQNSGQTSMEVTFDTPVELNLARIGSISALTNGTGARVFEWVHVIAYDASNAIVPISASNASGGYIDCSNNLTMGLVNFIPDGSGGLYINTDTLIEQSDGLYGHADIILPGTPISKIEFLHWCSASNTNATARSTRKSSIVMNVLCVTPTCSKPDAGIDQFIAQGGTATLTGTNPATGTWTAMTGNPIGATLSSTTGGVATATFATDAAGPYSFVYENGTCLDTMRVFITPPVCTNNMLINPSFEADALNTTPPTGWNGTGVVGGNNMNEPDGTKYAFDNDGPAGTLYQDVATMTGDTWNMTFYSGSHNPGSQTVTLRYLDASLATVGSPSVHNIVYDTDVSTPQVLGGPYSLSLTAAPSNAAFVRVEISNGGLDFAKVDAFCLEKTSVPCTADAGPDQTTCYMNGAGTATLAAVGTGTWTEQAGNPGTSTITNTTSNTTTVTDFSAVGTYNYIWNDGTCEDTMSVVVTPNGNVGNYVWNDLDGDGMNNEASTAGINGVTVELWKETAPSSGIYALDQTATTANDGSSNPGYYNFTVCSSANYKVIFPTSNGGNNLTTTTTTAATDNNSDADATTGESPVFAIDVNGTGTAKDNNTIDAGYAPAALACLGNYVWNDIDQDGVQDAGEVGVAGITVTLFNSSNQAIGSTITDAYGHYQFCELTPGSYGVGFTLPSNYVFTQSNTPGDNGDNTNSDVDPNTGLTTMYILSAGETENTIDAGIYFEAPTTASVGNFVWLDANNDGIQDSGETGVSGVTVTLCDASGNPVATTITNANGFYIFTDVVPGTYSVRFDAPIGLGFSPNSGTVSDASNSDANPTTGKTGTFTVNAGDNITYVDAGLSSLGATIGGLGDKVWYDTDQDGVQDAGEAGVAGVTVTLYASDGTTVLATTTTNAYGKYIFNNLTSGQYIVGFSNLPSNYSLTTNTGTDSVTNSDANPSTGQTAIINLGSGQFNMTYDAGIFNTVPTNNNSLGNYVWDDLNKNGIQDANEPGVAGITVTLCDINGAPLASTSTDASGHYLFPDLANGDYAVKFSNLPLGYVFSPTGQGTGATDNDADPSTGKTTTVSLTGGTNNMDLDAGINLGNAKLGKGTLGDIVWYDLDGDGLQDPSELGVAGVTVTLYESDGTTVLKTTTTNALGNYIFTGLDEGSYVVGFSNLPSGYTISPKNADAQGINGELNSDVNIATQKTDIINLGQGEDKMSVDMGLVPPSGTASLGNLVWFDLDQDGLQDSGEPGVQGIEVTLCDNAGNPLATTTTNSEGEYYFVGLAPGTYAVKFGNLPSGYSLTTQDADAQGINGAANSDANPLTGKTSTVVLTSGDNNPNLDAGIVSTTVASVGDYVWYDINQDGIQDPSEPGIGGVLVTLYDNTNTPVASTITRPDGGYIFTNVTPGTYTMGFSNTPSSLEFTLQEVDPNSNTGSNVDPNTGLTPSFTVTAGTHNPTIDAGLTTEPLAGLGDYVWYDVNNNGQQESGEPGIAGAHVTLYAADGTTVLATAITNGEGAYSFTNLPAGTYVIGVSNVPNIQVAGSTWVPMPTVQNTGADETDSDIDPTSGKTATYTLAVEEYNPTIDAGFFYVFATGISHIHLSTSLSNTTTKLDWNTQDEHAVAYFSIERSIDGSNFRRVKDHAAIGNTEGVSNYNTTDNIELLMQYEAIYYRIKVVDVNGQYSYSNMTTVRPSTMSQDISIYPTVFEHTLNINYQSEEASDLTISLTDVRGRKIKSMKATVSTGMNRLELSDLSSLASGTYYIHIKNENTQATHNSKVIKK
ncbi:MAG: SdrD B-like domain-containing protein [Chitinophagaceae bacterium]